MSGTSMAAPHIAGISALIKQLNPSWNPAMIASAISTTATGYDSSGEVMSAESYGIGELFPSNHFDHGAGHVNPARALDPGLVLPTGKYFYLSCRRKLIVKTLGVVFIIMFGILDQVLKTTSVSCVHCQTLTRTQFDPQPEPGAPPSLAILRILTIHQ